MFSPNQVVKHPDFEGTLQTILANPNRVVMKLGWHYLCLDLLLLLVLDVATLQLQFGQLPDPASMSRPAKDTLPEGIPQDIELCIPLSYLLSSNL